MQLQKFLSFLIVLCVYVEAQNEQTCQFYRKFSPNHTLCKPKNASCNIVESGVSAEDAQAIIAIHNELRQKVASGKEERQPPAANMMKVSWDGELASVAQRLADQCVFAPDCAECRKVEFQKRRKTIVESTKEEMFKVKLDDREATAERFQPGQNLHLYSTTNNRDKNWKDIVTGWYNRVEKFNPQAVDKFQFAFESSTYTQVVWSETQYVGCGVTSYRDDTWNRNLYVCNYGPSGNVIGDTVYIKGTQCSKCPKGSTCSNEYPALCEFQAELDLRNLQRNQTTTRPEIIP